MTKTTRLWIYSMMIAVMSIPAPVIVSAAEGDDKDLASYKCKDFMRIGGSERDIAIAFLHGYLFGKADTTKFNTETASKANEKFIEHCLDNPGDDAIGAMMKQTQ